MLDVSVVVPLYNEEESLPDLIAWIDRVVKANQLSHEVILVDDGSNDRSWEVVTELKEKYPEVKGIRFRRNYGKSAALHVGFQATSGEVVITMDADLQDSPDEIPELRRMIIEDGYDLVSGWKKERFDPFIKNVTSKFFNGVTRWVSKIKLHDFNCGLKAYRSEVVKNIEVYGEMHRYIPLLAKWAGFKKIGEKPVKHQKRLYGVTKFGLNRFINGFLDLMSIMVIGKYMRRPMHFFGTWGVVFGFIGGGVLLYLAIIKLVMQVGISDRIPALIFGTVMLLIGVIFLAIGLLGEMIGRNSPYKNQYRIGEYLGLEEPDDD